jgi:hypothetical protein
MHVWAGGHYGTTCQVRRCGALVTSHPRPAATVHILYNRDVADGRVILGSLCVLCYIVFQYYFVH